MFFEEQPYNSFDSGEIKARKACDLYEQGHITQALTLIEDAIEINPANSSWHFNKALTLDAMEKFDLAIEEYKIAIELGGPDEEMLNSLGVDYTRIGCYDMAIETFEEIEKLNPLFEPSYCNRIITYTEMAMHDKAEELFYMAQQIEPDCPICFYNIGNSLFIRGNFKKAIHCWKKTEQIEPNHPQINYRIAQACWLAKDLKTADKYFLLEIRKDPGNIDVIFDYGLFLLEQGKINSAREKFNRIIELDTKFAPAYFYLGEIEFNSGNYEKSVTLFNKAIKEDPSLLGPDFRLAQNALLFGDIDQAKSHLVSELQKKPENANSLVSMASMFLKIGSFGYAIHCLLKASEIDENNPDVYYYLGVISNTKRRFYQAEDFFKQALKINTEHLYSLREYAITLLEMGNIKQAKKIIEQAILLAPHDSDLKKLKSCLVWTRITNKIKTAGKVLISILRK